MHALLGIGLRLVFVSINLFFGGEVCLEDKIVDIPFTILVLSHLPQLLKVDLVGINLLNTLLGFFCIQIAH